MIEFLQHSVEAADQDHAVQPRLVRTRRHSHSRHTRLWRVRRRLRHMRLRHLFLVVACFLAVTLVGSAAFVLNSVSRADAALSNLGRTLASVQGRPGTELTLTDFERMQASLSEVASALRSTRTVAAIARPLAALNSDVDAALTLLGAAQEMVSAAQSMLTGVEPALTLLVAGSLDQAISANLSSGERLVDLLRLGQSEFALAGERLTSAAAALDRLPTDTLSSRLLLATFTAREFLDQLQAAHRVLVGSPDLLAQALGFSSDSTMLVLAQNNDELRPSGGYLSTFGWFTLRDGQLLDYSFSPTTAASPNPPPTDDPPDSIPSWWIRYDRPVVAAWDGSWYADFPSTAQMALWYYNQGANPRAPIHAALSIDLAGFEAILRALGSVTLPAYEVVVNADNFRDVVYDIRARGEGDLPHKQFIAALYRQMLTDLANADPQTSQRLLGAILDSLQEKHILLYFDDPHLNESIEHLGWSGRQDATSGHDYLLVADANLGNKSNRSIARQTTLDVALGPDGGAASHLRLNYAYPARIADADPAVDQAHHGPRDYSALQQVFVPTGSTVETSQGFDGVPIVEDGDAWTTIVSRFDVPYDTSASVEYSYRVPRVIESTGAAHRYRLLVQRQPGSAEELVSVQIRLPVGASLLSASPAPAASYRLDRSILEFQFALRSDQWVQVVYSAPASPAASDS